MRQRDIVAIYIIDDLIRAGKIAAAVRELKAMAKRDVPRESLVQVGLMAWRLKLGKLGARLLHPVVRPPPRFATTATSEEKCAYAASLILLGASEEALGLLAGLEEPRAPLALFLRISVLVSRWEYGEAIPLLREYLASPAIDSYEKLVARANLVAAYLYEKQLDRAEALLPDVLKECLERRHFLLYGNALVLSALHAILTKRWSEAEHFLRSAEQGFGGTAALDAFFILKWRGILRLHRDGATPSALKELARVRAMAVQRGHWETVRDCDHFRAVTTKDFSLLCHVYHGSPFPNYRRKLLENFGEGVTVPSEYRWQWGDEGVKRRCLDLTEGLAGNRRLKKGNTCHRLLIALCSDFYRPFRSAALHARTYPGDVYNPLSSPTRVRQALTRVREWVRHGRLPLRLEEKEGAYRLVSLRAFEIRLRLDEPLTDRLDGFLRALRARWPTEPFSVTEASQLLGMPTRSVYRWLQRACDADRICRFGEGLKVRYHFREAPTGDDLSRS